MRRQLSELSKLPADVKNIPIPDSYLHSSGISAIPKTFVDKIENFWLDEPFEINCPTHILHPENDELCPVQGSVDLTEKIIQGAGAKLEILPGATHTMSSESDLLYWKKSFSQFYEKS